jgi:hypothetical protein
VFGKVDTFWTYHASKPPVQEELEDANSFAKFLLGGISRTMIMPLPLNSELLVLLVKLLEDTDGLPTLGVFCPFHGKPRSHSPH